MKKSMVRMGAAFGAALVGFGLSAAQQGVIKGNAYVITVGGDQTVTMNADDVAALGDGKGAVTEFRKEGAGTLVAIDMPDFAGTNTVAAGIYKASSAAQFGTSAGPTVVADGATVWFTKAIDLIREELVITGTGVGNGMGVLHCEGPGTGVSDRLSPDLGRITMLGDCTLTGGEWDSFKLENNATYVFNMNGHTMTFETGDNVTVYSRDFVNAGHFVCRAKQFWLTSTALFDDGPEHTITIEAGSKETSADISFWNNPLAGSNNWTIVYKNAKSPNGIYFNKSGTWYGDIVIDEGVDTAKITTSGNTVHFYGNVIGSGKLSCDGGTVYLHGDNSAFTGTMSSSGYAVAASPKSVPDVSKTTGGWVWLCKTPSAGGEGWTAEELRDRVFPVYDAKGKYLYVDVVGSDVFDYPYELADGMLCSFSNRGTGTFALSGRLLGKDFASMQSTAGGAIRLTGTGAGENTVAIYGTTSGRTEFFDFAADESGAAFNVYSSANASKPTAMVFSNAVLRAKTANSTFNIGVPNNAYAKAYVEILEGSVVSNDFIVGGYGSGSAAAVYVRGGEVYLARNGGIQDSVVGYASGTEGYWEQSGGLANIQSYVHFGQHSGSHGLHYITGGTGGFLSSSGYHIAQAGHGVYYQTGGTFESKGPVEICDSSYNNFNAGAVGEMTVSGEGAECTVASMIRLCRRFDCVSTVNINDGGRITTPKIVRARYGRDYSPSPLWYTNDIGYVNFNGGILRTTGAKPLVFGDVADTRNGTSGEYTNNWPTAVTIFPKGAFLETDAGTNARVTTPLRAPSGQGVTAIPMPEDAVRTGYVAPPIVTITGDGTNATAVATIDSKTGTWTGIVITSPGWGYTRATASVARGGKTDAWEIACTVGDVSGGGLTKLGAGTLVLEATNTYTGATCVDAGTLKIAASGLVAAVSPVEIGAGATLEVANGQNFASVSGSGTLVGDVTETDFVADGEQDGVTASGTFTIGGNPVFTLRNLTGAVQKIVVLRKGASGAIVGTANLKSATFAGEPIPDDFKVRAYYADGKVVVKVSEDKGTLLLVR